VIQQRRKRCTGQATAQMGPKREINVEFWWGNTKRKNNLEELDTDGRILKRILKKQDRYVNYVYLAQER
jgi:hypothetical protein